MALFTLEEGNRSEKRNREEGTGKERREKKLLTWQEGKQGKEEDKIIKLPRCTCCVVTCRLIACTHCLIDCCTLHCSLTNYEHPLAAQSLAHVACPCAPA